MKKITKPSRSAKTGASQGNKEMAGGYRVHLTVVSEEERQKYRVPSYENIL